MKPRHFFRDNDPKQILVDQAKALRARAMRMPAAWSGIGCSSKPARGTPTFTFGPILLAYGLLKGKCMPHPTSRRAGQRTTWLG
jgi:hypothetical protein